MRSSRRAGWSVPPSVGADPRRACTGPAGRPRSHVQAGCEQTIDGLEDNPYAKAYTLATLFRIRNAAGTRPQAAITLGVEALKRSRRQLEVMELPN